MEERCRLELIGITYNQIESGVYAVILQQVGGTKRIPIIIGTAEAQSIECKLQEIIPPRPLSHDLFVNFMTSFNIELKEVLIRRMPNGVFAADLVLTDGVKEITIDSRSSDAIAIAIRIGAPIYCMQKVLDEAGFEAKIQPGSKKSTVVKKIPKTLSDFSTEALHELLNKAVQNEQYEQASKIKDELDKRKNPEDTQNL